MIVAENIPLAEHTTFKIGGPARVFCRVMSEDGLVEAVKLAQQRRLPIFILGGGSNVLVSDAGFSGVVIKIEIKGVDIQPVKNKPHDFILRIGAGEMWDDIVALSVDRGLFGIENLSAIPGTVGAAPIQNIGAYGGEVSETVLNVRAYDTVLGKYVDMDNGSCRFDYRDSIFKRVKGRYIITRVDFCLSDNGKVNISYKDLRDYFAKKDKGYVPTLKEVRDAVIAVRWGKLPDWKLWGTAGSFFKNPIIPLQKFIDLKQKYHDIPGFAEPDGRIKVSLGWILDKVLKVKGICVGNACTYEKQALVVVAKPGAKAADVVSLTNDLMKQVKKLTGIEIEAEVEWVN